MVRFIKYFSLTLCIIFSAFPTSPLEAAEALAIPPDYTAVYQVLRNDKNLAEVTIQLSHQDDVWTLHGFTHDMRGLAKFLKAKGSQTTTGNWKDGKFAPENYKFSFSVIGYKTKWHADFDWQSGVVTTSGKSGQAQLPLAGSTLDPFSLSLNIRSQLASNQTQMAVNVIEEGEIDNQVYQADREESIDTTLGCLDTTRVKRIHKSAKRNSMVWYASDHNYVPVLIQHSKKKGNSFSLQIISLDVNGQPVQPGSPCDSISMG